MKAVFKSHFNKAELWSGLHSFLAFAAVDIAVQGSLDTLAAGNWSQEALAALVFALARSLVKFVLNIGVAAFKKSENTPSQV